MVQCNNCGAEISNETDTCLVCGSSDINNSYQPDEPDELDELEAPSFTPGITSWLVLMCIGACKDIYDSFEVFDYSEYIDNVGLVAYSLMALSALRLVGIALLFMRRRLGLYLMAASIILVGVVLLITVQSIIGFLGLVGLFILYRLLNREHEGESMSLWESMK